jgi:formyl-CoA transferase
LTTSFAACGLASVASTGRDRPDYVPTLVADKTAGMAVVNASRSAVQPRAHWSGQYVEVLMLETLTAFVLTEHLGGLTSTLADRCWLRTTACRRCHWR